MLTGPAIALFLSLAGGTWLDVPFVKQPKNDCGPASVWMLMQYWKSPVAASVDEIHRSTFSAEAAGVYARDMARYLTSNGFQVWTYSGDWDDLTQNLIKGRPLITALRGSPLHYVVVAGIDPEAGLIFVNDAASRKLQAMHRDDFEKRWSVTNNWTLLATPTVAAVREAQARQRAAVGNDRRSSNLDENTGGHRPPLQPDETYSDRHLQTASAAFRRDDYREAKREAKLAAKADPLNKTTTELLATLYTLDGNLEAGLKYWNRIGQPSIRNIAVEPQLSVDPVTLDRTFAFSRGSVLKMDDYLLTRRRIEATHLASNYNFDLVPVDDNRFDLTLHAADKSGSHYLSWLRGLPYQTVRPQRTNIGGRTINWDSLLRWDRAQRRAMISLDGPLAGDSLRFSATVVGRDELWNYRGNPLSLRRIDGTLALQSQIGSRATWTAGLTAGTSRIGYRAALDYDLARWPEQRLVITGGIRAEIGRNSSDRFAKVEPALRMHWNPKARGSDYETTLQLRTGRASSATPLDELFVVGLDRDGDLVLRAHPSVENGRKGASPIGNRYFLLNAESDKILHDFGIARISAGPFIDVARMSSVFVDSGVVVRLSLGPTLSLSFSVARDLRSGRSAAFFN